MSNRRVKSLEYDDDDFDYDEDYEEEYNQGQDEVSPEDKEHLRLGTIEVREILGRGYQATDAEIQDALWNYYYDIGKTVAYIKSEQEKHKVCLSVPKLTCNRRAPTQGYVCAKTRM